MTIDQLWLLFGLLGQTFFSARFVIQWIMSEKEKKSIIPSAFWYLSLLGGTSLLVYAIHKEDPVFIIGQGMGLLIYLRNLYLIKAETQSVLLEDEA